MIMRCVFVFFALLLCCQYGFSQKVHSITKSPYVESQYSSEYGDCTILGVALTDECTLVIFEYIVSRYICDSWIALSSGTVLSYGNRKLKIDSWGFFYGDNDLKELSFNQRYSMTTDRRYAFFMLFPPISQPVDRISIYEDGKDGFYWENIHLETNESGTNSFFDNTVSETFTMSASGTCFAINKDGYLITNYHVIEGAQKIRIRGINKDFSNTYPARIIATDEKNDLALLKVDNISINAIPYGIVSKIAEVGDEVFVLGYPLRAVMGDEIKLTNGLISSRTGFKGDITSYQISATVQSGNSGGPLFDKNGNIIGIINSRLPVENAAYAIKTPYLLALLSSESNISVTSNGSLRTLLLTDQVKQIRNFIYIVEVE